MQSGLRHLGLGTWQRALKSWQASLLTYNEVRTPLGTRSLGNQNKCTNPDKVQIEPHNAYPLKHLMDPLGPQTNAFVQTLHLFCSLHSEGALTENNIW